MRLIIAGSRTITNADYVFEKLDHITDNLEITEVVSGTARGVDRIGEAWANGLDIPVRQFPANWNRYGKSAGYRRNEEMANYADALIAFWDGQSRGTKHMIDIARDYGLQVHIVRADMDGVLTS